MGATEADIEGLRSREERVPSQVSTVIRALFEFEKRHPDKDIDPVRADTSSEMQLAFKIHFSVAKDFIDLVHRGCAKCPVQKGITDSL